MASGDFAATAVFDHGRFEAFDGAQWRLVAENAKAAIRRKDALCFEFVVTDSTDVEFSFALGSGDPFVADTSDRSASWPQARFTFEADEDLHMFLTLAKQAAQFFRLQLLHDSLALEHRVNVRAIPPLVPAGIPRGTPLGVTIGPGSSTTAERSTIAGAAPARSEPRPRYAVSGRQADGSVMSARVVFGLERPAAPLDAAPFASAAAAAAGPGPETAHAAHSQRADLPRHDPSTGGETGSSGPGPVAAASEPSTLEPRRSSRATAGRPGSRFGDWHEGDDDNHDEDDDDDHNVHDNHDSASDTERDDITRSVRQRAPIGTSLGVPRSKDGGSSRSRDEAGSVGGSTAPSASVAGFSSAKSDGLCEADAEVIAQIIMSRRADGDTSSRSVETEWPAVLAPELEAGALLLARNVQPASDWQRTLCGDARDGGVVADGEGESDPVIARLLGSDQACHSCHYHRTLVLQCPNDHIGHEFCAACLLRRLAVDFHAVRQGFVAYNCPVCTGACPCSACRLTNVGVRPYRFQYARCVDRARISTASGGQAVSRADPPLRFRGLALAFPGGSATTPHDAEVLSNNVVVKRYYSRLAAAGISVPPQLRGRPSLDLQLLNSDPEQLPTSNRRSSSVQRIPTAPSTNPLAESAAVGGVDSSSQPRSLSRKVSAASPTVSPAVKSSSSPSDAMSTSAAAGSLTEWERTVREARRQLPAMSTDEIDAIMNDVDGARMPLTRGVAPPPRFRARYSQPVVDRPSLGSAVEGLSNAAVEALSGKGYLHGTFISSSASMITGTASGPGAGVVTGRGSASASGTSGAPLRAGRVRVEYEASTVAKVCMLCDRGESLASSRKRLVNYHPLVPIRSSGRPVFLCDECETKLLDLRSDASAQGWLQDSDGVEDMCCLCGSGSPDMPMSLTLCSGKCCPRSFCEACMDYVLDTTLAKRVLQRQAEWLCPVCSAVALPEIRSKEELLLQHKAEAIAAATLAELARVAGARLVAVPSPLRSVSSRGGPPGDLVRRRGGSGTFTAQGGTTGLPQRPTKRERSRDSELAGRNGAASSMSPSLADPSPGISDGPGSGKRSRSMSTSASQVLDMSLAVDVPVSTAPTGPIVVEAGPSVVTLRSDPNGSPRPPSAFSARGAERDKA